MPRKDDPWVLVSKYSELALVLPISTLIGWGIGWGLDKLFHTHVFYVIFILFGIAAGMLSVYRTLVGDSRHNGS